MSALDVTSNSVMYSGAQGSLDINSSGNVSYSTANGAYTQNSLCYSWNNQMWVGIAPQWSSTGIRDGSGRPWAAATVCGLN